MFNSVGDFMEAIMAGEVQHQSIICLIQLTALLSYSYADYTLLLHVFFFFHYSENYF